MKRRIFASMGVLAFVTILISSVLISAVMYRQFSHGLRQEVRSLAIYVATGLDIGGEDYLSAVQGVSKTSRITLIAPDGMVLFDSDAEAKAMENHLDRPEVATALRQGYGEASRLSATLGSQTFYYAVKLDDGSILRIANTVDSIYAAVLSFMPHMLVIAIVTLILATLIANWQTQRIVTPINALDLENPMSNEVYDEISPLLTRIAKQNLQIEKQMAELVKKREEFTAITENMREGIVILDGKAIVLSINKSAKRLFGVKNDTRLQQRHVLALNRSLAIQTAVEQAIKGTPCEKTLALRGRQYQVMASPVWIDNTVRGVVLLILDVTEKLAAEEQRREFSANVSHELKTPLTSISGYAEIMKDGLVKQEDIPRFAGRIYTEANHLIDLVENIIRLSGLDEGKVELANEDVDLFSISQAVCSKLAPLAVQKGITMQITGESATISGAKQILESMIYNLCENAIKYNVENGRVDISVLPSNKGIVLTVADTGIGITPEHQERVFERFYRAEKSHSKATGGAGLGLSIVKRGAMYHNAKIELESQPDRGTTIRLCFPLEPSRSTR
jgi:two-component system phosphate regulon sensor histidine kinase PhoR